MLAWKLSAATLTSVKRDTVHSLRAVRARKVPSDMASNRATYHASIQDSTHKHLLFALDIAPCGTISPVHKPGYGVKDDLSKVRRRKWALE